MVGRMRTIRTIVACVGLAISLAFAACTSAKIDASCGAVCAASNACEDNAKADCAVACAKVEAINSTSACDDEYDLFLECATSADLCDPEACASEAAAYSFCIAEHCANTNDQNCD